MTIETKNHFALSLHLIRQDKKLIRHKLAFLLGSIMPDINLFTYIRGHTWAATIEANKHILELLMSKQRLGLRDTYRLGKVIHYVGDYFTFPHNPGFTAGMWQHYKYEKRFGKAFCRYIKTLSGGAYENIGYTTGGRLTRSLEEHHANYTNKRMSMADDCLNIIAACTYVTQAVCAQRLEVKIGLPAPLHAKIPDFIPKEHILTQKSG